MSKLLAVPLLLLTVPPAYADGPSAAEILTRATEAAGGKAWKRPSTLALDGEAWVYPGGSLDQVQHQERYEMRRTFPQESDAAHSANGKVRFDAWSDGAKVFTLSYDGETTYDGNGPMAQQVASNMWSASFGFGIIRFWDSPGFAVERLSDDQVEGHATFTVRVNDASGQSTIFGIDQADFGIRMVGFDTPRGWHQRIYSAFYWHDEPRFRQPGRVRLYYDGVLTRDIRWHAVRIDEPLADATFVVAPAN